MTTHPLSRPLTVEPRLDPPDDPPMIDCELCSQECDARPFSPYCEGCESLLRMDVDGLRALVIDLQDQLDDSRWVNGNLRGHITALQGELVDAELAAAEKGQPGEADPTTST